MKTVYLSGPVTGVEDYEIRFTEYELKLQAAGFQVINPCKVINALPKMTYEEKMQVCCRLLEECDMIYMMPGWRDSRGACREWGYAQARMIDVIGNA